MANPSDNDLLEAERRRICVRYLGRCNVCGRRGFFDLAAGREENLRESLTCPGCRSNSRDRFLSAVLSVCLEMPPLLVDWPVNRGVVIREPSAYRGRAGVLADKVDFRPFSFPDENLEALTDADESIDHVIAADVFEHVRRDDVAFSEIYRVLKPGGFLFLEVPFNRRDATRVYVRVDGDKDVYLRPPQYHAEETLVYRIYGRDLLQVLKAQGFSAALVQGEQRIWGIAKQVMFIACKSPTPPALGAADWLRVDWA